MSDVARLNKQTYKQALKRFKGLKNRAFILGCRAVGNKVLQHIEQAGVYRNITGNTRGSIAYGIYKDGVLKDIMFNDPSYILRSTLKKGERYNDFVAPTGKTNYYGDRASEKFLQSYKPLSKGISIVFVVGTYYAEYLERKRDLNVLTDSFEFVKSQGQGIIRGNFNVDYSSALPFDMPSSVSAPF